MPEVKSQVHKSEFGDVRAMIVGGSRGLGEVTAKIIAAGSGRVTITYAQGAEDARRVQSDIHASGDRCGMVRYDVRAPADDQLISEMLNITHLYYFATPRIERPAQAVFSPHLFHEFIEFYVNGFHRTCLAAMHSAQGPVSVFYPSSEFVTHTPSNLTEYAMAKAAGEILCTRLSNRPPFLRVTATRLPQLITDQTEGLFASSAPSPLRAMLNCVRLLSETA
jgi:NAD(P)-dependent dehydrogenase (short-subunit alcohol dehydrogenase family)